MTEQELKEFLDEKVIQYNHPRFIDNDPIKIPHLFSKKEDIEISGFLVAMIAWGKRDTIIKNGIKLMNLMDNAPYDFIINHTEEDLSVFDDFVHRTFNAEDCKTFMRALQNIYINHGGMEYIFSVHQGIDTMHDAIVIFRYLFFNIEHWARTRKHIPNPELNAASKRMHMFLRWMVRKDNCGVDFGIWKNIPSSKLSIPLDVHTGTIARKLNLLHRKQDDLKAVKELDAALRRFDPIDPVKYDFALFGLGIDKSI